MKRYNSHTAAEKLALTNEEIEKACQLEAAERGIAIPVSMGHLMDSAGYKGFQVPADATKFYELRIPTRYNGSTEATGICFRTEEAALKAMEGAVAIISEGYAPNERNVIRDGEFTVQAKFVSLRKVQSFGKAVESAQIETEEYDKMCEEIRDDLYKIRQAAYNAQVIETKKAKYLELAEGDEETARRFWKNIEKSEWDTPSEKPAEVAPPVAVPVPEDAAIF